MRWSQVAALAVVLFGSLVAQDAQACDSVEPGVARPSANEALGIYRAATRQSKSATEALRRGVHDLESSDATYQASFRSAVWEGLKLIRPSASPDALARMANHIDASALLASASAGAAYGDYIVAGISIDTFTEIDIERGADDAFRLGYSQALKRDCLLTLKP